MAETMPGRSFAFREHAGRRALAGEVHARPYEQLSAPLRASHLAILHNGLGVEDERDYLRELLAVHGAEPPGDGATHFARDLGGLRLKWERHSEFSTYTSSCGSIPSPCLLPGRRWTWCPPTGWRGCRAR
ncbi:MAG TPA: DUF3422 family protein [Magnetospirillum sp.]|nr:DUF3422 family protein [Magnetospirillum sp.]